MFQMHLYRYEKPPIPRTPNSMSKKWEAIQLAERPGFSYSLKEVKDDPEH